MTVLVIWTLASGCSPADRPPTTELVSVTLAVPQAQRLGPTRSIEVFAHGAAIERLTGFDSGARPAPRLVDRWSTSADGLTWRLHVRPAVVFQDGTPLTPAVIKSAIERAAADESILATSVCLSDIRNIVLDGAGDVVITLARRCYFLLDDLDVDISRMGPSGNLVGTGPFVIQSKTEDEITMAANPHYYLGRPTIDRLVMRSYSTLRIAWAEMMRGRVDFLWEVGPDTTEFLSDQTGVEVRSYPAYFCPSIVFNPKRAVFKPQAVRRALSLATDREQLVQHAFKGQGVAAMSPVWPNYWALEQDAPPVPFDRPRARALLASRPRVSFTCLLIENFTLFERLALLVQQQLRDVGVDMRLESLPPGQFVERIGRGDFDAAIFNPLGGPFAVVHHRFWHTPDPTPRWNSWGYSNAAVDAALDAMRDAPDDGHFKAALARFVTAIQDDPPALFLVWPSTVQAVSRRFVLPESAKGRDALAVLGTWRLRTEDEP